MKLTRRGFLGLCAAAGLAAAAATTRLADVVKDLVPQWLILYGDGEHDDTEALQALIDGKEVMRPDGELLSPGIATVSIQHMHFQVFKTLEFPERNVELPHSIEFKYNRFDANDMDGPVIRFNHTPAGVFPISGCSIYGLGGYNAKCGEAS